MASQLEDGLQSRASNNERFVAFAFAAADLVAEVDQAGTITYAAGAYRSRFGSVPEAWIGRPLHDMITQSDHHALNRALVVLAERGRLTPWTARLANEVRTEVALAGLRLASNGRPVRMCVTFALPPTPPARGVQAGAAGAFAHAVETRMQSDPSSKMSLLEVRGGSAVGRALETLATDSLMSEVAPGRFGLLAPGGSQLDIASIATSLETMLNDKGCKALVAGQPLSLDSKGLTQRQAARALRRALEAFAQEGLTGLNAGGFGDGLANFVRGAMAHYDDLREAIHARHFSLAYQPIVHLDTRALHHVEALLRPKPIPGCPARTPQDFVVLAETVGLAMELDLAVARVVCDAAVKSLVPVAFNVSGQSMQEPLFREQIESIVDGHPARKARKLAVEMTETSQLEDITEAAQTAEMLRCMGIPFCLDDFGAGAADVRVLRGIPADIVKLDGSYIPGIVTDSRERGFVAAMVEIARASKAAVVAERIETQAEADIAKAIGINFGQGWLFGRPGPLPNLPSVSSARRRDAQETWS